MISVIIPYYNSDSTLKKAIISSLELVGFDGEIVLVDDCSNDTSFTYINELLKIHPNIIYYRNNINLGVSISRNKGLELATKQFVTFLDSDDIFNINYSDIHNKLLLFQSNQIEVVIFKHKCLNIDNLIDYGYSDEILNHKEINNLITKFLRNPIGNSIITYAWGKIYKKEFLNKNNINFNQKLTIYEDFDFCAKCLTFANRIYISNYNLVSYSGPGSLSSKFANNPLDFLKGLEIFNDYINDVRLIKITKGIFLAKTLFLLKNLNFKEKIKVLKIMKDSCDWDVNSIGIRNFFLRFIIRYRLIRYPKLCALILSQIFRK
jgi:glycosyltransferase involved in cell wall biosynthesis